jgi:ubiquinone/menaquinone biosynthesis C-methylase UbiE
MAAMVCRAHPDTQGAGLRFLEVGAGTGRLATFVRDNYRQADVTVTELSPFYLERARENNAYWHRQRDRDR